MSISLTRILQQITGLNTFFQGPNAGRSNGVVLEDSDSVTWTTDGQGNIQATAAGSGATGPANEVLATPNGSSGTATLRALVSADLPVGSSSIAGAVKVDGTTITATAGVIAAVAPANVAFTNVSNTFTASQVQASGTGTDYNGSHQWLLGSSVGAQNFFFQDVSNGSFYPLIIHSNDGQTAGPMVINNGGFTWSSGSSGQNADTTLTRNSAGVVQVGTSGSSANASGVLGAAFFMTGLGAQLTAAGTITLTNGLHHITGATSIITMNLPTSAATIAGAEVTLIADSATITMLTGGNIATATTITIGNARKFVYDGTSWYPVI